MNMSVKVHHKITALPIIRSFVSEVATYYGANTAEIFEFGLAAEEVAEHIITTYPITDKDTLFNIECEIHDNFLRFIFSNTGIPVDVNAIPKYNTENPEESIDGLKFFLIERLTDHFVFENLGSDGWQSVFDKKILALEKLQLDNEKKESDSSKPAPRGKLELTIASPNDAYEITKLAYFTYRYTYAKKVFYYPELLKEQLASQQIISLIVKNEEGHIVAHSALLRSDNCRRIAESGAIMSLPDYRNSTAVLRLVKYTNNFLNGEDNPGINILDANLVTAHTASQRLCRSFKFTPLALKLSVHDRANFIDIDGSSDNRETLLYSLLPYGVTEEILFYPPKEHVDIIKRLTQNLNLNIKIQNDTMDLPQIAKSKFIVNKIDDTLFTRITVVEIGEDFFTELKKILYELSLDDIMSVALNISIAQPLPKTLEKELNALQFFFSGIIPKTTTEWDITYTVLNRHKLDFEQIQVVDTLAVELKDYIENCYKQVIP